MSLNEVELQETPKVSSWTYKQLEQYLRNGVKGEEAGQFTHPDEIDFGLIAKVSDRLAVLQQADKLERLRLIGVETAQPNILVFSATGTGYSEGFEFANLDPTRLFSPDALDRIENLAAILHSHPYPVVFSPSDLLIVQIASGFIPLAGVSTENFKLFALRSKNTTCFGSPEEFTQDVDALKQKMKQAEESLVRRYPREFQRINRLTGNSFIPRLPKNLQDREQLNVLYDLVLRGEARRQSISIYKASPGVGIARKYDLSTPILRQ